MHACTCMKEANTKTCQLFFQMVSLFFIQQVEVDGVQCMLEILDTAGQVTNLSRYYKTISLLIKIHVRNMEHHTIFAACMFLHLYIHICMYTAS